MKPIAFITLVAPIVLTILILVSVLLPTMLFQEECGHLPTGNQAWDYLIMRDCK
jgi:hypothetical protein